MPEEVTRYIYISIPKYVTSGWWSQPTDPSAYHCVHQHPWHHRIFMKTTISLTPSSTQVDQLQNVCCLSHRFGSTPPLIESHVPSDGWESPSPWIPPFFIGNFWMPRAPNCSLPLDSHGILVYPGDFVGPHQFLRDFQGISPCQRSDDVAGCIVGHQVGLRPGTRRTPPLWGFP